MLHAEKGEGRPGTRSHVRTSQILGTGKAGYRYEVHVRAEGIDRRSSVSGDGPKVSSFVLPAARVGARQRRHPIVNIVELGAYEILEYNRKASPVHHIHIKSSVRVLHKIV